MQHFPFRENDGGGVRRWPAAQLRARSMTETFEERVAALQLEFFADDIEPPADAKQWSPKSLFRFFESGGEWRPASAPSAATSGAASTFHDNSTVSGIVLRAAGSKRFRDAKPKVFVTSAGIRIVYQISEGRKKENPPLVFLGGGQTGRVDACLQFSAESDVWRDHTALIFDRRNTAASDVCFDGVGSGDGGVSENEAQRDDIIELLHSLELGPYLLIGFSSGARLFALIAFARPDLVKTIAMIILTGGALAASSLSSVYYLQHAEAARHGGMQAVVETPHYAACIKANARSREHLLAMQPEAFISAMQASAALYTRTANEPALGLTAAALKQLSGDTVFVCNTWGEGPADGAHTSAVSRAVASCIHGAEIVVNSQARVWFAALHAFVRRHSATPVALS